MVATTKSSEQQLAVMLPPVFVEQNLNSGYILHATLHLAFI